MRKLLALIPVAVVLMLSACVPGPGPAVLGDSDAYLVAQQLGVTDNNSWAEGTCDLDTPDASHVLIHAGGHSTILYPVGYYNEAQWQRCMLDIIDHYGAANVWVATAPQPLAIYCAWGTDEYNARLTRANQWKINTLPSLRRGVHIVRWDDLHVGADCTHFTDDQASIAAQRARAAGY